MLCICAAVAELRGWRIETPIGRFTIFILPKDLIKLELTPYKRIYIYIDRMLTAAPFYYDNATTSESNHISDLTNELSTYPLM